MSLILEDFTIYCCDELIWNDPMELLNSDSYYCMSLEKVLFNIEFGFQSIHSPAVLDHGFPQNSKMQSTPSSYSRESSHIFVDAASNNSYQEL